MGIFSRFERSVEHGLESAADKMFDAPISPVQISKKAEKAMRREKMVGAGKQYAPTLYTILVNEDDDKRLFGYYPTLAGETETYLAARAAEEGLTMDGAPLVRFIVDEGLKHGKFDVVAELVSAPIIAQLRREEMQRYGLASGGNVPQAHAQAQSQQQAQQSQQAKPAQVQAQPQQVQAQAQPHQPEPAQPAQEVAAPQHEPVSENNAFNTDNFTENNQKHEHDAYNDRLEIARANPNNLADPAKDVVVEEAPAPRKPPLPYVPEEEIDRTIDYGEYTFNSQDFEDYEEHGPAAQPLTNQAQTNKQPWEDEDDISVDADLSGLDVEAYNPYSSDSRDFFDNDAPASNPNTIAFAGGNARPDKSKVSARLIDKTTNRSYDLAGNRLVLGRSSVCDIIIDDVNASRSHVELRQESPGVWVLTDLGSTNGTKVNGEDVISCELELGDRIVIGTSELVFLQD